MQLIHLDCPAKRDGEWKSPEFEGVKVFQGFAWHLECPECHMRIAVCLLKDPKWVLKSA